jgi:hypothetical protein
MKLGRFLLAMSLAGCGGEGGVQEGMLASGGTGIAEMSIPLEISEITTVVTTVTAPDIPIPIVGNLAIVGNIATGLIAGIPAGVDRSFSVQAFVGAVLVCTDTQLVEIIADARVTVSMTLDCSVPPPEAGEAEVVADFNFPPEIVSVTAAPSPVEPDGLVDLAVTASDPDGDPLTYTWTATDGTFADPAAAGTTWTAPAVEGDYSITITVSDGTASVSLTIVITVSIS